MDKQIIAIGGGGFGRNPGIGIIEKYILDQSDKDTPNICFIPTATGDSESYKVSYYSTMTKLNCNPTHLDLFKRTPNLEKLIQMQDIIFVGIGIIFGNYLSGAMRNPSAAQKQFPNLLLGFALAEATGLFGLVVALIILFAF